MKKISLFLFTVSLVVTCIGAKAQVITTIAGTGTLGYTGDGGAATAAELSQPFGVTVDAGGNVYLADFLAAVVRKISASGVITTIAGNGISGYSGGDGGPATDAELVCPRFIAVDGGGNVYISDDCDNRVRKVNTLGIISTVAGTGTSGFAGDGGPATSAEINSPYGLAIDGSGNLFIADNGNQRIRKVSPLGIISTVAGNGTAGYSDGSPATAKEIAYPCGVALDGSGNLYIADSYNGRIRKLDPTGTISTAAGMGYGYGGDGGAATAALFNEPVAVTIDGCGNIYISDNSNERVRKVNTSGIISTIAGTGTAGFFGDGGMATAAKIDDPWGIALDESGNIYFSDVINHRIRRISAVNTVSAITGTLTLCTGSSAALSDASTGGAWVSSDVTVAIIGSSGIVTGETAGTALISYEVGPCSTATATATITVNPIPDAGAISGVDSLCPGATATLSETITGGAWNSSSTAIATITGAGHITAVTSGSDIASYTVTELGCSATVTFPFLVRSEAECSLGMNINPGGGSKVSVYPNPNEGAFTLLFSSLADQQATVVIGNLLGEKVKELTIRSNTPTDVFFEQAGIYLISVNTAGGRFVERMTVVK